MSGELRMCRDCLGYGWRHTDDRIVRCEKCNRFATDAEAVAFVHRLAKQAVDEPPSERRVMHIPRV